MVRHDPIELPARSPSDHLAVSLTAKVHSGCTLQVARTAIMAFIRDREYADIVRNLLADRAGS
jgi:hypothetical protein